jgi:ribosomal protein S18 acetylase RimI-like enzyme
MLRTVTGGARLPGGTSITRVLELREVPADRRDEWLGQRIPRIAARRASSRWLDADVARTQVQELVERTAETSSLLDVVEDGAVVGGVWVGGDGDELVVHDAVLDRPESATELVPLLVDRARARSARMIGIGVHVGDATAAAIASYPGFRLRATNMALRLDDELPEPGALTLRPMTQEEFDAFVGGEAEAFAEELVSAGEEREHALERSRTMMAELLPSGQESPGMEFHVAEVGGQPVGDLWLSTGDTMAFVYNIEVRPDQRRRGHGAAIMDAAARRCRDLGHPVLGLNVFAHNPNARALYDKLGYEITHEYVALDLPDAG